MNFLLHRHLAARDLKSDAAGIGAMLPDLWRMADRRVRVSAGVSPTDTAGRTSEVLAGIEHHVGVDRWFHGAAVFADGERLTLQRFRAAGVEAAKLGLFAHVTWEMALDGALLRREGLSETLASLRRDIAAVRGELDTAASLHHFQRIDRSPAERAAFADNMERLFVHVLAAEWIAGYRTGAGIAARLDGMRTRMGLGRFLPIARARLTTAIDEIAASADDAVEAILARPC